MNKLLLHVVGCSTLCRLCSTYVRSWYHTDIIGNYCDECTINVPDPDFYHIQWIDCAVNDMDIIEFYDITTCMETINEQYKLIIKL